MDTCKGFNPGNFWPTSEMLKSANMNGWSISMEQITNKEDTPRLLVATEYKYTISHERINDITFTSKEKATSFRDLRRIYFQQTGKYMPLIGDAELNF
jgi:hypothetical protein